MVIWLMRIYLNLEDGNSRRENSGVANIIVAHEARSITRSNVKIAYLARR